MAAVGEKHRDAAAAADAAAAQVETKRLLSCVTDAEAAARTPLQPACPSMEPISRIITQQTAIQTKKTPKTTTTALTVI